MKKKLEAELISIAHRILKLKNKSELSQLQRETRELYEKLSVLVFVEDHFAEARPTIGKAEAEQMLETAFEDKNIPAVAEKVEAEIIPVAETANEAVQTLHIEETEEAEETEVVSQPIEEIVEEKEVEELLSEAEEEILAAEETPVPAEENTEVPVSSEDDLFKPAFEWAFDPKDEPAAEKKTESGQIAFDDLLGSGYVDPVFVKPEENRQAVIEKEPETADVIPITKHEDKVPVFKMAEPEKTMSLNDRISKGITVGLNDRIAFVKHLFGNSNEDYNRVLSQLITFDTFAQAQDFIDNMVKPDYNNWDGKDEYAERFMEVVEKKFS